MLVGMALLGLAVATGISRVPAIAAGEKFRWNAFREFWHDFAEIRSSRALFRTVLAIAFFWFLGAVYLQNVIGYGRDLLHLSNAGISYLVEDRITAANDSVRNGLWLPGETDSRLHRRLVELDSDISTGTNAV